MTLRDRFFCGSSAREASTHTWRLSLLPPTLPIQSDDEASVLVVAPPQSSPIIPEISREASRKPPPKNNISPRYVRLIDQPGHPFLPPVSWKETIEKLSSYSLSLSILDSRTTITPGSVRSIQRTTPSSNRGAPCSSSSISPRT